MVYIYYIYNSKFILLNTQVLREKIRFRIFKKMHCEQKGALQVFIYLLNKTNNKACEESTPLPKLETYV
jgi:hypothetical protein